MAAVDRAAENATKTKITECEVKMSLQNSPGFDQVELDDVSHPPEPKNRRGVVWGIIIVLVLIVIGLAVLNIWGGAEITALRGVGSLSGFVVDEKGNGVQAEIIVAGTNLQTMTDESASFCWLIFLKGSVYLSWGMIRLDGNIQFLLLPGKRWMSEGCLL